MSDAIAAPLSPAIEALRAVASAFRSVPWGWFAHVTMMPFRIAAIPLAFLTEILLVILAPAIHIFSYFASLTRWTIAGLVGLKPLYSFLSAAAGVGIVAGILVGVASSLLTSYLGMQDDYEDHHRFKKQGDKMLEQSYGGRLRYGSTGADSSSDAEWPQWEDSQAAAIKSPRRRLPAGLLSQTIHEEDDSDV